MQLFYLISDEQKVYFEELTKLIEDSYLQNGNKSVILITHSMGSTMSLYLLNQKSLAWKSKHIRAQISIAGVWAGTVRAMKVFAVGDNLGSFWVSEKALRKQQRSTPSLAWLMPNPNFWDSKEILLQSPEIDITTENFQEFYNYLNATDGLEMWKDTKDLIKNLEAPQVELFCLYSTGVETVEQMVYYKFPNNHPVLIKGDGDGTVNLRSLEAFKKWTNVQKAPIRFKSFKRVDHLEILKDKRVVKEVKQIVKQILEKF